MNKLSGGSTVQGSVHPALHERYNAEDGRHCAARRCDGDVMADGEHITETCKGALST